jgi:hypothetical protein
VALLTVEQQIVYTVLGDRTRRGDGPGTVK